MKHIAALLLVFFVFGLFIPNAFAENVPEWVKNTAGWWAEDVISETEFVNAISYLIKAGIINVQKQLTPQIEIEKLFEKKLMDRGWLTDVDQQKIRRQMKLELDHAFDFAQSSPLAEMI